MMYYQFPRFSHQDSVKILEADIHHANALAAAIPRGKGGARLQMKLVYDHLAPVLLFLLQWMDCSCVCLLPRYLSLFHVVVCKVYKDGRRSVSNHGRKATIRDFYAIILPSLQRIHGDLVESENFILKKPDKAIIGKKGLEDCNMFSRVDFEREDECGICLEPCTKIVLPNCCHAMCINCYRDWNTRSESCPFCRGNIKRVKSRDLWVLTCDNDVVDRETVSREDLFQFYHYINSLPKDSSNDFLMQHEYLL